MILVGVNPCLSTMQRIKLPRLPKTTAPGYKNGNGQEVIRPTGAPSATFAGQSIYALLCHRCRHTYGSKGVDNHHRRCPNCQGGQPGEQLRLSASLSLFD